MKRLLARTLLALAVLTLISVTVLAQDSKSTTITINGGRNTVAMKAPSNMVHNQIKPPASPFFDNIGSGGYNCCSGWTVSDGSPIGTEYTPANDFVSAKSGTLHSVSVGYGFVTGTNGGIVTLDKDCKGMPCGTIDKTNVCRGKVSNLPTFGSTGSTVVTIKCKGKKKLAKGKKYWVYVETPANTWNAWNMSNTSTADFVEGTDDVWGTPASGQPQAAMTIK